MLARIFRRRLLNATNAPLPNLNFSKRIFQSVTLENEALNTVTN